MRLIRGTTMRESIDDFYRNENEGSGTTESDFHLWLRKMVGRLVHVCYAIEYAHSCGVVHRDLKPSNIMLGKYGETLVVDWGLAKATDNLPNSDLAGDERLVESSDRIGDETRVGTIVGTAAYMSPEQAEGRLNQIGPWTDVFCLGSTLYSILTGKTPYPGSGTDERMEAVRAARFDKPRSLNLRVPRAIEAICLKAMSAGREDRYTSAVALAGDLEQWLADEPVIAYAEPVKDRIGRKIRRHRGAVLTALIALVGLTIGAVSFSAMVGTKNREITRKNAQVQEANTQTLQANQELQDSIAIARKSTVAMLDYAQTRVNENNPLRNEMVNEAVELYVSLRNQKPEDKLIAEEYARVLREFGNNFRWKADFAGADKQYNAAIAVFENLQKADGDESSVDRCLNWGLTLVDRASSEKSQGKLTDAMHSLGLASELVLKAKKSAPDSISVVRADAIASFERAGIHRTLGEEDEALRLAEKANANFSALAYGDSTNENDHLFLIMTYGPWGRALEELGRKDDAAEVYEKGVSQLPGWLVRYPDHNTRFVAARLLISSAEFLIKEDLDPNKAKAQTAQGMQLIKQNCDEIPGQHIYEFLHSEAYRLQAMIAKGSGDLKSASENYETARQLIAPLVKNYVYSTYPVGLAKVLRELAILERDAEKKGHLLAEATQLCEAVLDKTPNDEFAKKRLGEIREVQGRIDDNN
jgi:tetratricopeptide (TPR) repeat protein